MPCTTRHSRNPVWMTALVCCLLVDVSGCSLFVMAGKMLQGDPQIDAEFDKYYGKSLQDSGKKVAILCTTPETVKSEFSSLDLDLAANITHKLAVKHIEVIENHRIGKWIDDHGGDLDLKEMGEEIEADLIVQVVLNHFDYREENSPELFRGRASGRVVVYELIREADSKTDFESKPKSEAEKKQSRESSDDKKKNRDKKKLKVERVRQICDRSFDSTYPTLQPVSITQMQPEMFRRKFLDRIGDELARIFYRHKPGTDI